MSHIRNHKSPVLNAKVGMREVGQDCHDLIMVSEGRDERANRSATSKIV